MKIGELHDLIKLDCPIEGINSNGAIWFASEATVEQRAAAQAIMDQHLSELSDL